MVGVTGSSPVLPTIFIPAGQSACGDKLFSGDADQGELYGFMPAGLPRELLAHPSKQVTVNARPPAFRPAAVIWFLP